ncbi:MAG: CPBP family intramembrane metalloprotease [Deltaproteobacteria bacterium]|nr:CPBP family intramembrane metalloprotease [Deltaproteobacteria bacterium]
MKKAETSKPSWAEVTAVITTAVLHFLSKAVGLHGFFIVAAVLFWIVFILWRAKRQPGVLSEWGFRADNLLQTFLITATVSLPGIIAMAYFGSLHGTFILPPHLCILLILYPIWGIIQQFLIQGLVVRNLSLTPFGSHPIFLVLLGATLFGLVHTPNILLMLATFCLGLLFVPLYLRLHNLWPLGLFHGWLGSLFYLWVLGHDPWQDLLTTLGFTT